MNEHAGEGLRVIEISNRIAGDYCTKLLSDHGAEVIKIEPPEGSPLRREGPFPGDIPDCYEWGDLSLNADKKNA